MGTHREDGYSADVEGFLVVDGKRIRLAKTNDSTLALVESCELAPGAVVDLLTIVDGRESSRLVRLPAGISRGQSLVVYSVAAPF